MRGVSGSGVLPNAWLPNVVGGLTALGTNQATAYVVPNGQDFSVMNTVASGTGVVFPATGIGLGESYEVANHGANALLVYPPLGGRIGTLSINAAYSLAAGKLAFFKCVSPNAGAYMFACCP